jgi:hypothetical protein
VRESTLRIMARNDPLYLEDPCSGSRRIVDYLARDGIPIRLRHLDTRQTSATLLPWTISCSAVLSLRMIFSAVCLVRFMVESPAQSGRMRTLIHPGTISRVHVIWGLDR